MMFLEFGTARKFCFLILVVLIVPLLLVPSLAQNKKNKEAVRQEEQEDYYKKWLEEDVTYIITPEERTVFNNLTTAEEKERFIEQFWFRRDPEPRTPENEFKTEHYRRIAYANDNFWSSLPGWKTDRGRIYIIHGKPADRETHPSGGSYTRPNHEGGGETVSYPFEIWRYHYIEGIGTDVELTFVDQSMTRQYELSYRYEDKDALRDTPQAGWTEAELNGAPRTDRPYLNHDNRMRQGVEGVFQRSRDDFANRYRNYVNVQRPTSLKYNDLKELVEINLSYENFPFQTRQDFVRLNDDRVVVPITIQFENRHATFEREGDLQVAKIGIYGLVTTITNQVVQEFEDDVRTSYGPDVFEQGLGQSSIYQKVMVLDQKKRYKLDLVVKDLASGKIGSIRKAIVVPSFAEKELGRSSVILSNYIRPFEELNREDEMFLLGDVKVRPNLSQSFTQGGHLGVYFQVYNVAFDQTTSAPQLRVTYRIYREGEMVREIVDDQSESTQYFSEDRVVLIRQLPLRDLEAGRYQVQIEVADLVGNQNLEAAETFEIVAPTQRLAANVR